MVPVSGNSQTVTAPSMVEVSVALVLAILLIGNGLEPHCGFTTLFEELDGKCSAEDCRQHPQTITV